MRYALVAIAGLLLTAGRLSAAGFAVDAELPAYEPGTPVSGEIVCAGNQATDDVIMAWAKKFARYHAEVSIRLRDDTHLTTDAFDVAIAAGDIDLIPSARELVPSETERLTKKLGGPPLVVAVATGSYATKSGTHALAFYVSAANPLERISIAQIREIYAPRGKITKWGQLGLGGEWEEEPIHVFSVPISDPNGNPLGIINYLQKRVFGGPTGLRRSICQVDSNGPAPEQHMLTASFAKWRGIATPSASADSLSARPAPKRWWWRRPTTVHGTREPMTRSRAVPIRSREQYTLGLTSLPENHYALRCASFSASS